MVAPATAPAKNPGLQTVKSGLQPPVLHLQHLALPHGAPRIGVELGQAAAQRRRLGLQPVALGLRRRSHNSGEEDVLEVAARQAEAPRHGAGCPAGIVGLAALGGQQGQTGGQPFEVRVARRSVCVVHPASGMPGQV